MRLREGFMFKAIFAAIFADAVYIATLVLFDRKKEEEGIPPTPWPEAILGLIIIPYLVYQGMMSLG